MCRLSLHSESRPSASSALHPSANGNVELRLISQEFDNRMTSGPIRRGYAGRGLAAMKYDRTVLPVHGDRTQDLAAEIDRLLEKQVGLLKTETFVGLTPTQRQEYDQITNKLHELFSEMGKTKQPHG